MVGRTEMEVYPDSSRRGLSDDLKGCNIFVMNHKGIVQEEYSRECIIHNKSGKADVLPSGKY